MDLLYALADHLVVFMNDSPGLLAGVVYVLVASIPVVLLHELGHAAVAQRRLGAEVDVTVGGWAEFARLRLGQISVSLNVLGRYGTASGVAKFDAARATARDILVIAVAGPAASLVGTVATAWAWSATTSGIGHHLLWAATAVGATAVLNLIPLAYQERRGGATFRTDGLVVLDAVRVIRATR